MFLSLIGYASWEGWIGHSLNPIGCLFETLAESSLAFPVTQKPTVLGKDKFLKAGETWGFPVVRLGSTNASRNGVW